MRIDIDKITSGEMRGEVIYVCDYRKPDLFKKAARNLPPTKVVIYTQKDYDDAGKKAPQVYYSNCALVPLNNKEQPVWSRVIKPYDNTGYRSYPGIALEAFSTEEECIDAYNLSVQGVVDDYNEAILNAPLNLIAEQKAIKKLLVDKK